MTRDIEVLQTWIMLCLFVAAACSTLFPLVWAFSRWWEKLLGRLIMLLAFSLALAVDLTLVFALWTPGPEHILLLFWLNAIVFGLIAASTLMLTLTVVRMNYIRCKKTKKEKTHV